MVISSVPKLIPDCGQPLPRPQLRLRVRCSGAIRPTVAQNLREVCQFQLWWYAGRGVIVRTPVALPGVISQLISSGIRGGFHHLVFVEERRQGDYSTYLVAEVPYRLISNMSTCAALFREAGTGTAYLVADAKRIPVRASTPVFT